MGTLGEHSDTILMMRQLGEAKEIFFFLIAISKL